MMLSVNARGKLVGYFVDQLQENGDRQPELETEIFAKRTDCQAKKDGIIAHSGDSKCQLLETLDKIDVVGEGCHENVFIGNHCKSIVSNSEKLCSLVLDEPAFHNHISESFDIYSEHHQIILSKRVFTKAETLSVKEL